MVIDCNLKLILCLNGSWSQKCVKLLTLLQNHLVTCLAGIVTLQALTFYRAYVLFYGVYEPFDIKQATEKPILGTPKCQWFGTNFGQQDCFFSSSSLQTKVDICKIHDIMSFSLTKGHCNIEPPQLAHLILSQERNEQKTELKDGKSVTTGNNTATSCSIFAWTWCQLPCYQT